MNVLITGIAGFTGRHLAGYLLSQGCSVFGAISDGTRQALPASLGNQVRLAKCDIRDDAAVRLLVSQSKPKYIFHLCAKTTSRLARDDPRLTVETNVCGTRNLLEAVREQASAAVVLVPGSSGEYGLVGDGEQPVAETNPFRPVSFYAVSKIAQGMVAYQYHLAYGVNTIRTRTFNIIGPGQSAQFVCSTVAKQLAEIETGLRPPIVRLGNMEARRDFTDVRDVVRAYWLAIQRGIPGDVYNICSGRAVAIRDMVQKLRAMTSASIQVTHDETRANACDVPVQFGDFSKLRNLTGWRPEIPIDVTLRDTLDYWRGNLGRN